MNGKFELEELPLIMAVNSSSEAEKKLMWFVGIRICSGEIASCSFIDEVLLFESEINVLRNMELISCLLFRMVVKQTKKVKYFINCLSISPKTDWRTIFCNWFLNFGCSNK